MQIHRRTAHSTAMRQIYIPIHSNSMNYHRIALPFLLSHFVFITEHSQKECTRRSKRFFLNLFFIVGAVFTGTGFNLFPLV